LDSGEEKAELQNEALARRKNISFTFTGFHPALITFVPSGDILDFYIVRKLIANGIFKIKVFNP